VSILIFLRVPPSLIRKWSRSANVVVVAPASALPVVTTVPVASGSVIVLSAVGSTAVSVVSFASSVAPSKQFEQTQLRREIPMLQM